MPVIAPPLRLDRLQRGLFEVFAEATGVDVHWGFSEVLQTQLTETFVALTMIGGPTPNLRKHRHARALHPIESVTLTVTLDVGTRVGIILNAFNYFTDIVAGDTVSTVRNRLIADINHSTNTAETATAAAFAVGAIDLTADMLGGITSLAIYGSITVGVPTLSIDAVLLDETTHNVLVNVQAYSRGREPLGGAWVPISQCQAALRSELFVEALRAYGLAVWDTGTPTDLSNIAEGHWETRVSFDLVLALRSRTVERVDTIETLSLELNTPSTTMVTVVQS